MIEHLSLSSAGPNGLIQLGLVFQALQQNIFSIQDLKSIHGTSCGSIIAVLLSLNIPIQELVEYVITRKWNKWLKPNLEFFMTQKGCVSIECIEEVIAPFFHAYDISLSITMKELYEHNKIDLHIYTTAVTNLVSVDINHITFPDLPVIQAICMSSSVPILFTPVHYQNDYYIDGGLLTHCPFISENPETILYILIDYKPVFNLESPIEFIQHIIAKSVDIIMMNTKIPSGNVLKYNADSAIDPTIWINFLTDETYRKKMIDVGIESVNEQMTTYKYETI
jgi:hypothetical protein